MLTIDILTKARGHWIDGQPLEAGKLIFERLPSEIRPQWANNILRSVVERTGIKSDVIDRVISTADCRDEWGKAHDVFSAVRDKTLQVDQWGPHTQRTLLQCHLVLAELVAKVTYNATNPPDEFDEDSGWWIAPCLKDILDLVGDKAFSEATWSVFCLNETGGWKCTH
jgi:hypothetical protein